MENKFLEERVTLLEKQVAELQQQIACLMPETPTPPIKEDVLEEEPINLPFVVQEEDPSAVYSVVSESNLMEEEPVAEEPIVEEPVAEEPIVEEPIVEEPRVSPAVPKKPAVSLEAKFGKIIIPIAGSALIIFALVLFGSLIKPHLTDGMKAVILASLSLSITAVGLWKMNKENKYYNLFSALAGCGLAACYVSTLIAHFALDVLPETAVMVCIVVWIAGVILLSKYKSKMFGYICYVGILVAAYMTIQKWCDSSMGLIAYVVSISALFAANFSRQYKQVSWLLIQYPVVMLLMTTNYSGEWFPSLIIYITTLAVLVGQLLYYRRSNERPLLFAVPTAFSLLTLLLCADVNMSEILQFSAFCLNRPAFGNEAGWGILIAITFIGLSELYLRVLGGRKSPVEEEDNAFVSTFMVIAATLFLVPSMNYGDFCQSWFGSLLIPSFLFIGLGFSLKRRIWAYAGFADMALFTLMRGVPNLCYRQETCRLDFGVFFYIAALILLGIWIWKHYSLNAKLLLILAVVWAIFQLQIRGWIDPMLTYLLLLGLGFALNTKMLRTNPLSHEEEEKEVGLFVVPLIAFAVPLFRFVSSYFENSYYLSIASAYTGPVVGVIASMSLWGVSYWRKRPALFVLSIVVLAMNMIISFETGADVHIQNLVSAIVYGLGYAGLVYWTVRHYNMKNKILLTGIALLACCMLYPLNYVGLFESWALCSFIFVLCNLTRYEFDPVTKIQEPMSHTLSMLGNGVMLFIGTILLRIYVNEPLFIGHKLEGTETILSVLLVVVTLTLACTNIKRVYDFNKALGETPISIYNGLKFTWTLFAVLCRFSTVSYIISIVGILLALVLVVVGFMRLLKGLRLYGLILSMLCVLKLIFFDITFDNVLYRPISFLVAGLLLFVLSFVYFRLEKTMVSNGNPPVESPESEEN